MASTDKSEVMGWNEVPVNEIDDWNIRLQKTNATYRQYPYWNEPYRKQYFFSPRYLTYGDETEPSVYTCILSIGIPGARIGLMHCGLVPLREGIEIDVRVVQSFIEWARTHGFIFFQITHPDQLVLDRISSSGVALQINGFPFTGDARNSGIVRQLENDDEMLSSFQSVARYEIRAAIRKGYEIRATDTPEELANAWPMFRTHAKHKGFRLSKRPLAAWLEVMRRTRPFHYARLYRAYLGDRCVQAILVLRYGLTAEFMMGAINIGELRGNISPACLLHWHAIRDFNRLGCESYNFGGPGDGVNSKVGLFKRKFRPIFSCNPPPITLVINPRLYRYWSFLIFHIFIPLRYRFRDLKKRFENKRKTIREAAAEMAS